jgi:hypothetical protein
MQYESIQDYYYNQLTDDSLAHRDVVGHLWFNILGGYLFIKEGFGLEAQPRESKQSDDISIRCVKKGIKTPLTLVGNKRVSLERSDTTWADAVTQLTRSMKLARAASNTVNEDMFGIVTVGHYSRFYVLHPHDQMLTDHQATGGKDLEFARDETEIVSLILSIKERALRPSSS